MLNRVRGFPKSVVGDVASRRGLASLSITSHGAPAASLKYNATKVSPVVRSGEVLVSIQASQVTLEDIKQVRGISLRSHIGLAGSAAVGTSAGGTPVFIAGVPCWADTVSVPSERVFKLKTLKLEQTACLPTYLTAWNVLHAAPVHPGDNILQHQSDSPVCEAIAQVGKALGLNVVSLTSAELAEAQIAGKLKEKYKSPCVVSGASGRPLATLLRTLAPKGALVYYEGIHESLSEISNIDVPVSSAIFLDTKIMGVSWLNWVMTRPDEVQRAIDKISELVEKNALSLKPTVFGVSEYVRAFEVAQGNKTVVIKF